jgi:transcription elongation factor Elf1
MDIHFECEKCGQHLVIDIAAAGLTIQCSACGADLTVPKQHTTSSAPNAVPTYHELCDQSRDLAYELRVDEAIRVWKQAEEARAREKGYQLNEMFSFQGKSQNLFEQATRAVKQPLRHLTAKEEMEVIGALVWQKLSGSSHGEGCNEIRALVVGSNLQWPAFEEWFRRFKKSHTWPSMWKIDSNDETGTSQAEVIDFYESELTKPTDPLLAQAHELFLPSRRLLFGRRIQLTPDKLSEGGIELEKALSELVSAGFARRHAPASLEKRLESLSFNWLQALQKKYEVAVPRAKKGEAPKDYSERKQRIVQPLIAAMGAERLIEELPPEEVFELITPDVPRAAFEQFRADLLAHTLSGMMESYRWFNDCADLIRDDSDFSNRIRVKAILTDDCPCCLEASKRLESAAPVTLEMLPPFHPGCRCCPGVAQTELPEEILPIGL